MAGGRTGRVPPCGRLEIGTSPEAASPWSEAQGELGLYMQPPGPEVGLEVSGKDSLPERRYMPPMPMADSTSSALL